MLCILHPGYIYKGKEAVILKGLYQSQPLYEQAYDAIKKGILKGDLKAGSKIVATKLAEEYQISRTPLREALRQLTKEGLLIQSNMGATVVTLDHNDYEDLLHCRLILEQEIIRLAIPHISSNELKEAEDMLRKSEQTLISGDNINTLQYNTRFHQILIEACPNTRMVNIIQDVRSLLLIYRANILKSSDYSYEIITEHREILESIINKDVELAVEKVKSHILNDKRRGQDTLNKLRYRSIQK
jgi:DNA-binding GntR family transcriptional regulator